MSVAERLQRVLAAATLRNTPKKRPVEQMVTSPSSNPPDRAAKLACYTALYGSRGSSSVLSLAVPSGQFHTASSALLSQDLAPQQLVKSQKLDIPLELQGRGIISHAHREASLKTAQVSAAQRRVLLDSNIGSPSASQLRQHEREQAAALLGGVSVPFAPSKLEGCPPPVASIVGGSKGICCIILPHWRNDFASATRAGGTIVNLTKFKEGLNAIQTRCLN